RAGSGWCPADLRGTVEDAVPAVASARTMAQPARDMPWSPPPGTLSIEEAPPPDRPRAATVTGAMAAVTSPAMPFAPSFSPPASTLASPPASTLASPPASTLASSPASPPASSLASSLVATGPAPISSAPSPGLSPPGPPFERRPYPPPPSAPPPSPRAASPSPLPPPPSVGAPVAPSSPDAAGAWRPRPPNPIAKEAGRIASPLPPPATPGAPIAAPVEDRPLPSHGVELVWWGGEDRALSRARTWAAPARRRGLVPREGRHALRQATVAPHAWLADGRVADPAELLAPELLFADEGGSLETAAVVVKGSLAF